MRPFVKSEHRLLELGVGGGRVSKRTASLCKELHTVDISSEMLKRASGNLKDFQNVIYHHSTVSPLLPKAVQESGPYDFIYSFDVFVHCDIHTFFQTLLNLKPLMTSDTLFFVSVANLCSKLGFDRFKKQRSFKVAGFYCKCINLSLPYNVDLIVMSPDVVKTLISEAGFDIIKYNYMTDTKSS